MLRWKRKEKRMRAKSFRRDKNEAVVTYKLAVAGAVILSLSGTHQTFRALLWFSFLYLPRKNCPLIVCQLISSRGLEIPPSLSLEREIEGEGENANRISTVIHGCGCNVCFAGNLIRSKINSCSLEAIISRD